MKKIHLILLIVLPLCLISQEKVVLDIKVPILESADLAPAQVGATLFLLQSDWATVSDVGEDVAIWLKDYERHVNLFGQQVISCVLEIRDPSMVRTGNLQHRQQIVVRYWTNDTNTDSLNQKYFQAWEELSKALKLEAYYLGRKIEKVLRRELN